MPDTDCPYCGGIVRGDRGPVAIINLGPDATPADEANLRVQFALAVAAERARIKAAVEGLDAETRADPDMLPGVAALSLVLAIIDEP